MADGTARRLFPMENPIGEKVRVESDVYTVIGVTKPRTASAAIGGSLDSREYSFDAYTRQPRGEYESDRRPAA